MMIIVKVIINVMKFPNVLWKFGKVVFFAMVNII